MIISIASGKGGTGKTTVATSLALALPRAQILDCDVEEPNVHLFLKPSIDNRENVTIPVPVVDEALCSVCGRCKEVCLYKAIAIVGRSVLIFPELCHGCGACSYVCPEKALTEMPKEIGVVESGTGCDVPFVQGRLNIGAAMAPPVIRQVKKKIDPAKVVIVDAPPGTSCPVITAMKDTDFCILVTEPTPFGLNDLQLAVDVVKKLHIPYGVIINRSTLGNSETEDYCAAAHIPVLMRIPFDRAIASAYAQGKPIIDVVPGLRDACVRMYERIQALVATWKAREEGNGS